MNSYLERSVCLLGEDKINMLGNKTILVIGIGGVGGTALEALARSGFKKFILIDSDVVDISNLNRQVLFTKKDVGNDKIECAKNRLLEICPDFEIEIIKAKIGESKLEKLLKVKPDFVIDAIDLVEGKLEIYKYCLDNNIKLISSLGMGNRIDPEKVVLTSLHKTENDPLARKIRYEARQIGIDIKKIPVVFSKENPIIKSKKPYSMMMVPSTAGLLIAKYVLTTIL